MITAELLKANVTGLSEEQVKAITVLSENDENKVIAAKTKEIHGSYDADFEEVLGVKKPDNTKSYVFWKETVKNLKNDSGSAAKVTELEGTIATLKGERDDLQKKLKEGSTDAALKSQVTSLEQQVRDKEGELKNVRETLTAENDKLKLDIGTEKVNSLTGSLDTFTVKKGIKYLGTIPEKLLHETLDTRKQRFVDSIKDRLDTIETAKGKQTVVRDANGDIMYNPDNKQQPFTPGELYLKEISDLVDTGRTQKGGGTDDKGGGGTPTTLDLSGATSQVKADELIVNHILTNDGIAKGTREFSEKQSELRAEHKVGDLPIRD